MAWSSAPRHLGPRDRFIGWSADARRRNIRFVAYNSRYLIVPWVRVPHLASHLLGRIRFENGEDPSGCREQGRRSRARPRWKVVHGAAGLLQPVHEELIRKAAQGEVLHNDNTTMKILDIQRPLPLLDPDAAEERRGIFTSECDAG